MLQPYLKPLTIPWAAGSACEGLASTTFAIGIRKAGFGGFHVYPQGEDGSNPSTYGRVIAKLVPKYLSAMCDMVLFRERHHSIPIILMRAMLHHFF